MSTHSPSPESAASPPQPTARRSATVATPDDLADAAAQHNYERVFDAFYHSPEYCPWCFKRTHSFYPDFDEFRDDYLTRSGGGNHLLVISATSDADPNTYQEVVPPKTDRYGQVEEPPRPKTICSGCAEIDFDPTTDRSTGILLACVRNVARELHADYIPFSGEAAEQFIHAARQQGDGALMGHDKKVLKRAIKCGLKFAGRAP